MPCELRFKQPNLEEKGETSDYAVFSVEALWLIPKRKKSDRIKFGDRKGPANDNWGPASDRRGQSMMRPANPNNKIRQGHHQRAAGEMAFKSSFSELWTLGKLDETWPVLRGAGPRQWRWPTMARGPSNDDRGTATSDRRGRSTMMRGPANPGNKIRRGRRQRPLVRALSKVVSMSCELLASWTKIRRQSWQESWPVSGGAGQRRGGWPTMARDHPMMTGGQPATWGAGQQWWEGRPTPAEGRKSGISYLYIKKSNFRSGNE